MNYQFFQKSQKTAKELVGAPEYHQVLESIHEGKNWYIINTGMLNCEAVTTCQKFNDKVNAFKLCLQTYGPSSNLLPDFRNNKGKHIHNDVFHGHMTDKNRCTYVLEWAIVDPNKRTMTLVNFAKHENYAFKQKSLTDKEKKNLLSDKKNIQTLNRAKEVVEQTIEKIEKVANNYRLN